MERDKLVDVMGLTACLLWVAFSVVAFASGSEQMFARLGAIGTSVAVGCFVFIRHALPYPVGLHDKLNWMNARLNQVSEGTKVALTNSSILAVGLREVCVRTGSAVPEFIGILADEELLRAAAQAGPLPVGEWDAKSAELAKSSKNADEQVSALAFRTGKLQACIAVVATLQWGFGDWAVNLTKCGALQC